MKTLLWGNLVFFSSFLLHLVIWKTKLPKRQTKAILFILFGGLALALCGFVLYPSFSFFSVPVPRGPELLSVALYVTAFTLAYMITYSAIEADSPTLVMIRTIAAAGDKGIARDDFFATLSDAVLVDPRLQDLITDRMAVLAEGQYRLTAKGRLFASIFTNYRSLLGLGKGGG